MNSAQRKTLAIGLIATAAALNWAFFEWTEVKLPEWVQISEPFFELSRAEVTEQIPGCDSTPQSPETWLPKNICKRSYVTMAGAWIRNPDRPDLAIAAGVAAPLALLTTATVVLLGGPSRRSRLASDSRI